MRAIDYKPEKIELPEGWAAKASELKLKLAEAADAAARAKILEANPIWSDVKLQLKKIFHDKCWYTESPQAGTDVDVDHFRPKKRVAERFEGHDQHPGYWWLAYDLANYRYSCIVANRLRRDIEADKVGGKADRFPIADEATRAMAPDQDCQNEKTLLIDPCKPHEVALITFKEDGEAMSRSSPDANYQYKKASLSIEYYSINHTDFVKARMALRDEITTLRTDAQRYYLKLEEGDADHDRAYGDAIRRLRNMRKESAPYSAFCVAITDKYRDDVFLSGIFQ